MRVPRDSLRTHMSAIEAVTITAFLCVIHRGICALEQSLNILAISGKNADTNTARDANFFFRRR